ncbi:MAG: hypothetical protein QOJ94_3131 [Sphingomonadales bacterium]|jgi:hypothetical protein|nr:hypothetical protein [Sphingomonadales bacterium]
MRRVLTVLLSVALVAAPAAAAPVDPALAGAPWAAKPPPKLPDGMFLTLDRFRFLIDCIASSQWDVARPLFDTRIGSREEDAILRRLEGGSEGSPCSYAMLMKLTSMMMRGGIAEARYRYVYARNAPPPPVAADIAPAPEGASFAWVGFNQESAPGRLHAFAVCLVEHETGGVDAVLRSRWGSKEERAAYQALSRRVGPCLHPGESLKANSLTLRSWLGDAMYQYSRRLKPDV